MAFIATGIAVAAIGASAYQSNKAQKLQRKQANIENARARRAALAEARAMAASSENASALSGGFGGSAASASQSGINSKTASAIGNQQQSVAMNNAINTRISNAQIYGTVAELSTMVGTAVQNKKGTQ